MPNDTVLAAKERALIGVGASIAAGCQPCTEYHIKAARAEGACDRGLSLAVETALAARASATRIMDEWAERCQGGRLEVSPELRTAKRALVELTSVAAAVALNSVADLELHLAAALEAGAGPDQIRTAIEIARQVKRAAEAKIEAIVNGLAGSAQPGAPAPAGTGCGCR
jgi:AhpD family alkylhydroperoxidase